MELSYDSSKDWIKQEIDAYEQGVDALRETSGSGGIKPDPKAAFQFFVDRINSGITKLKSGI